MRRNLGETRSSVQQNHAVISPDSFERTTLPNWTDSEIIFVISPQMGAAFNQYFAILAAHSVGEPPYLDGIERFMFVIEGEISLTLDQQTHSLVKESYAYLPANIPHRITSKSHARLSILERRYVGLADTSETPKSFIGSTLDISSSAMSGDEGIQLKKLMPKSEAYDFEINTMDFAPGASLPYAETHFMEHGLLMLDGGGIYRLDDRWYPVEANDVIWMGPYCAQWFGAIGKNNARYLISKSWNRDPMDHA